MAEIAPPLFDSQPRQGLRVGPCLKNFGRYVLAAFHMRHREYISRGLYARLTGILFGTVVLVSTANILAHVVWTYTFRVNSATLTGSGIALTIVSVVIAVWIAIRQVSLVGSRYRAAGFSYAEWNASHIGLWLAAGLAIPVAAVHALFLKDSEWYRRYSEKLQSMPKPSQASVASPEAPAARGRT